MLKLQGIRSRILIPAFIVTIVFSVALFYVANSSVSEIIGQNLISNSINKISDIAVSEKRIATKLLSQASLFSRAQAVQEAYKTAYEGDVHDQNDPKMEDARGKLRSYFSSLKVVIKT